MTQKTKNLKFHNIKDKVPKDGQQVLYVRVSDFYSTVAIDIADIEYSWFEYDDMGFNGCQIVYDPNVPTPEGCKTHVLLNGRTVFVLEDKALQLEDFWWASAEWLDQF